MSRPADFLILIRPVNSLMVGFAVIVGIAVAIPTEIFSMPTLLGFLTGFLISSYSMVVNDIYDLEVDRLNKLDRPLAHGRIKPRTAAIYSAILLSLGIITSILISWNNFVIAAVFAFIAWIYNSWGKKQMLLGNIMVAASVAIPYIYGGSAVERIESQLLWFLALTSFLASTGREVIKTISDVEGDKLREVKSVARIKGARTAASIGIILFLAAVASSFLPVINNQVGIVYLILIFIPNGLFIYASLKMNNDYSKESVIRIKNLALIGMIIGMLVFILGGIYK